MKSAINLIITALVFTCIFPLSYAEEHTEKITRELRFEKQDENNLLMVKNINGSINVNGYSGNDVLIAVEKIIKADSERELEEGKNDIRLGVIETGDSIILYLDSPYCILMRKRGKISYHCDWDDSDYDYDFRLNFTIKVPYGTILNVSTVNKGDVNINDPRAKVHAGNVNGSVYLKDISDVTKASTVNGVIKANYTRNPEGNCSYSTVNGDITLTFLPDLSADVTYKTLNGDFYTNFDNIEYLANKVKTEKKQTSKGTSYKIEKNPVFRIGEGDIQLKFNTINGDMIIKKTE
jgi:DUF4097 and DUF4098 domain-containing protein YvlB